MLNRRTELRLSLAYFVFYLALHGEDCVEFLFRLAQKMKFKAEIPELRIKSEKHPVPEYIDRRFEFSKRRIFFYDHQLDYQFFMDPHDFYELKHQTTYKLVPFYDNAKL